MTALATDQSRAATLLEFDRTTSRWGQITMGSALVFSLAAPLYLVLFADLGITSGQVWTAFFAVAAAFFVLWFVEPITYYPVLGPAAMYQAFMIGNIANKLLPSALVAQATIGAKAGTKRGEFAALMAICGAAMVHVVSMLLFVGVLGTWLVSVIPADDRHRRPAVHLSQHHRRRPGPADRDHEAAARDGHRRRRRRRRPLRPGPRRPGARQASHRNRGPADRGPGLVPAVPQGRARCHPARELSPNLPHLLRKEPP